MNPQDMLERLVINAIDFLSKSIDEIDNQPKFSVIHFYTAVELFLKARLLAEHWSLVVAKGQIPDIKKFKAGNFKSISLEEAKEKLEKILEINISEKTFNSFKSVCDHRNRMVHFFHEANSIEENEALREEVAKEHLSAWYFLHCLILRDWKDVFEPWGVEIAQLDKRLRSLNQYLNVVFENLKPEIAKRSKEGSYFDKCPSCEFDSYEHRGTVGEFYDPECLVCGFSEGTVIRIDCPDCKSPVFFIGEGFSLCGSCGRKLEPDDLASELLDLIDAHHLIKDGDFEGSANCSNCDGYNTVIPFHGQYFCTSCFEMSDSVTQCQYCGEFNNGDMEDSFLCGCGICSGKLGSE